MTGFSAYFPWNNDDFVPISFSYVRVAARVAHDESWVDPFVGIKGQIPLGTSRFFLAAGAATGGFGIGSDLFYEINANIGCRWTEKIGTAIGYRMYDADYEDDGFSYDVKQDGWQVGLTWNFQTSSRG